MSQRGCLVPQRSGHVFHTVCPRGSSLGIELNLKEEVTNSESGRRCRDKTRNAPNATSWPGAWRGRTVGSSGQCVKELWGETSGMGGRRMDSQWSEPSAEPAVTACSGACCYFPRRFIYMSGNFRDRDKGEMRVQG